jgi:hypothetical protein
MPDLYERLARLGGTQTLISECSNQAKSFHFDILHFHEKLTSYSRKWK